MGISTHVLDTAAGSPASGVPVVLEVRDGELWRVLASAMTDEDGRVASLTDDLTASEYRITFDTGHYLGDDAFYPRATVVFTVTDPGTHHHIPLLLSPFGYTTYRGS